MSSRMDKYKDDVIPSRSDKNQELYKQIYNAYDSFENLIVPSNAREINPSELKKEIVSRDEYRHKKEYDDITNNKTNNTVIRKEKIKEEQRQVEEVYDINELLNKAVSEKKSDDTTIQTLSNEEYLKRLKLDNRKMNLDKIKDSYEDELDGGSDGDDDESLMKTANLSLEILSDLKGDSGKTVVSAPIKNDELPENDKDNDFYSSTYKFSKKDFEDKDMEIDEEIEEEISGNGKFFFKIFIIVLGIVLLIVLLVFLFNYLNRV